MRARRGEGLALEGLDTPLSYGRQKAGQFFVREAVPRQVPAPLEPVDFGHRPYPLQDLRGQGARGSPKP
jgi:hypothetical protein